MFNHEADPAAQENHGEPPFPCGSLLDSLVLLCRHFRIATTASKLTAGLPLKDGQMTPQLFLKAAERTGLAARVMTTPLNALHPAALPVVLLLNNRQACVITALDTASGQVRIQSVLQGGDSSTASISLETLSAHYSGQAIYARKVHFHDARSQETLKLGSRHWFWGTLMRSLPIYRDVLIASFIINLFILVSPLFVMNVYDRVIPNNAMETLWALAIGGTLAYILDVILKSTRCHFIDLAGKKSDILLSARLFEQAMGIEMASRPASVGSFARHLQEFDYIREFITSSTITTLVDIPFSLLILAVIAWLAGPLAWLIVLAMAILALYSLAIQPALKETIESSQQASTQKHATLIETLIGIEAIKAQSAEGEMQARWEQLCGHIAHWEIRTRHLANSVNHLSGFLIQFITIAVVVCGAYRIADLQLSMGGLIATVLLSSRCLAPVAQLSGLATRFYQARSALKALEQVVRLPQERLNHDSTITTPACRQSIVLDNMTFTYPNQPEPALQNISLTIRAGEKVAIVGKIGSGKSTLIKLLMRFYTPDSGFIRIDGCDLQQLSPQEYRQKVGYLPQDAALFYGTVRDNIAFGQHHVNDDQVLTAARLAGVTVFTDRHPLGLQMPVAERGANLSGGQQQAIALARALLNQPRLILLDEPCSAMDSLTEEFIRERLMHIGQDKTVILSTHRYSMLEIVDRIIVMEGGKVVTDGPKAQVFRKYTTENA